MMILTFVFCCRCFKMTGCVQFSWMFYWLMTSIILIIAGFQYLASVALVNTCQSYNYFVASSSNFNRLPDSDLVNGYSSCLFDGATSLMDGIYSNSQLTQFNTLVTDTNVFNNIGNFSTVETAVYDQVMNYYAYPETVGLIAATTPTQPLALLQQLNTYANYSAPGSNQGCSQLKDYFTFNTLNCSLYPVETGANVS